MDTITYQVCMISSGTSEPVALLTEQTAFTTTVTPHLPTEREGVTDLVVVDATTVAALPIVQALRATPHLADLPVLLWGDDRISPAILIDDCLPTYTSPEQFLRTVMHLVATSPSIRQLRRSLYNAERQVESLQDAHQKKDEFLSIILHELKNPMASIKGYADLLRRRAERNEQDPNLKGLRIISSQVGRMSASVEQLLDVSRISRNRLELRRKDVDLRQLLLMIVEEQRAGAPEHTIVVDTKPGDMMANIDEARIGQTFVNLLTNAVRYSPQGGTIMVTLERADHDRGADAVITVADEGIGIALEDQPRVFDQFFRGKEATDIVTGLGLGLFLARGVIERHGGRITIEGPAAQGTIIQMTLPLSSPNSNMPS